MKVKRKNVLAWILSLLFLCQSIVLPTRSLRAESVDESESRLGSIAIEREVEPSANDPRRFDVTWNLRNVSDAQEPEAPPVSGGNEAQNVVLVLDRSRSWDSDAEDAIYTELEMLVNSGKNVGVVSFGTRVFDGSAYSDEAEGTEVETPDATLGLTTDLTSLEAAVEASSYYGDGAQLPASLRHRFTQAALMEAETMLEGYDPARSRIILITLGAPTLSYYATAARENDNAPFARDQNGEKLAALPADFTGDVLGDGQSFDLDGSDALINNATNYAVPGSNLIVFDHSLPLQGTAAELRRAGVGLSVVAYDVHAESLAGGVSLEGDRAKGRLKGLVGSEEDFYDIADAYNLTVALQEAVAGVSDSSAAAGDAAMSSATGAETLQFSETLAQGVYPTDDGAPGFSYPEGQPQAAAEMGIQYDGASTIQAWNITLQAGEMVTISYSVYVDPATYADGSSLALSAGAIFQSDTGESTQFESPWIALPEAPEPQTRTLKVAYIDENGNALTDVQGQTGATVLEDQPLDTYYNITPPEIEGYEYLGTQNDVPLEGSLGDAPDVIYLVYQEAQVATGTVYAHFYKEGGQEITDDAGNSYVVVVQDQPVGTPYSFKAPEIDGYRFLGVAGDSPALAGTVAEGTLNLQLIYQELPKTGSVFARFYDINGNALNMGDGTNEIPVKQQAEIGANYDYEAPKISGYKLVKVESEAQLSGTVAAGDTFIDLIYEKVSGSVTFYFYADGQAIRDNGGNASVTVIDNAEVGTAYDLRDQVPEIEGYEFISVSKNSAPLQGTIQEGETNIFLVYEALPQKGSILLRFFDTNWNPINNQNGQAEEYYLEGASVGDHYHVEPPKIEGYSFSVVGNGAVLDGEVAPGEIVIDLLYMAAPKTGSVTVRYESEDGEEIADPTTLIENAEVGTEYQAEPIKIEGYQNPRLKNGSSPAAGTVREGEVIITYVYEAVPKTGSVIAKFITPDGTAIQDPVTVLEEGELDRNYHYEAPKIEGYNYQGPADDSAALDGTVKEGVTEIVLVYAPQTGSVTVRYESEDGEEIETATTLLDNVKVGTEYQAEPIKIEGYQKPRLKNGSSPAEGTVQEGEVIITYVYEAVPKTGSVIAKFITPDGTAIQDPVTVLEEGELDRNYHYEAPNIEGYNYQGPAEGSAALDGTVKEDVTEIVLVYAPQPKLGSVKVYFKGKGGKDIMAPQMIEDEVEVGEPYEVDIPKIEGYQYLAPSGNSAPLEGEVEEGTRRVYLIYKELPKTGTLFLRFEDEDGKQIADDERYLDEIEVGTNYRIDESEIPAIEGYTYRYLKNGSRPLSGDVQSGEQYIVLVYERTSEATSEDESKTGTVVVHYEDTGGLAIAEAERLYEDMRVGTQYEVTAPEIEGYSFSHLKNGSRPAKGEIKEGDNDVTFVYEPKEEPKFSNLSIRFEDEKGFMIHPSMTLLKDQPAGKGYRVQMPQLEGFEFDRIKDGSAPLEGELKEGENIVIAIYKRVEDVKLGSVYVRYFNEKDEEIRDPDTLIYEAPYGTVYYAVPPSIEGYEYVGLRDRSPEATGQVQNDEITVSFVYRSTKKLGSVQVRFLDSQQNKIREDYLAHKDQPVGSPYAIQLPHIAGYSFTSLQQNSAPLTGTIQEGMTTVVAVYRKEVQEERGSLVISYIDEAGKEIKPSQRLLQNAKAGTPYLTTIPAIEGYTFLGMAPASAPARGELKAGENQVRFLYRSNEQQPAEQKTGNVIVHYVDELDRPIIEDVVLVKDQAVGTMYETQAPAINGYEYLRVKVGGAAPEGKVQEGDLHVTFIYREAGTSASGEPPIPGTGEQMSPVLWAGISLLVLAAILIIVRIILKRRDDD